MQPPFLMLVIISAMWLAFAACGGVSEAEKQHEAQSHYQTGVELHEQGRWEEAISAYDEAIRLDQQYAEAYYYRGAAYVYLGQPEKAIEDHALALLKRPSFAGAIVRSSVYEVALDKYDEAIRLSPQDVEAYAGRALTYTFLGKDAEAQRDVEEAIRLGYDPVRLKEMIIELADLLVERGSATK